MKTKDDSRQIPLNLDTINFVPTNNVQVQKTLIETASVLNFSTKVEQKNKSELKQLYVEILKSVEHIK